MGGRAEGQGEGHDTRRDALGRAPRRRGAREARRVVLVALPRARRRHGRDSVLRRSLSDADRGRGARRGAGGTRGGPGAPRLVSLLRCCVVFCLYVLYHWAQPPPVLTEFTSLERVSRNEIALPGREQRHWVRNARTVDATAVLPEK